MKEHELLLWMTSKDIDRNSLSLETEGKNVSYDAKSISTNIPLLKRVRSYLWKKDQTNSQGDRFL